MTGILWGVIQSPLLIQPRYALGQPHHVTLQFGVDLADWEHLLKKEFTTTCLYEAWNNDIQAIAVKLPSDIPCANQHPHITVSWKQGISPVESNNMLASKFNYKLLDLEVSCKIEFLEWN
jgi:Fungal tRNA ligase phosphodiesterase domain